MKGPSMVAGHSCHGNLMSLSQRHGCKHSRQVSCQLTKRLAEIRMSSLPVWQLCEALYQDHPCQICWGFEDLRFFNKSNDMRLSCPILVISQDITRHINHFDKANTSNVIMKNVFFVIAAHPQWGWHNFFGQPQEGILSPYTKFGVNTCFAAHFNWL